ncbi:MAG: hypothetical protein ABI461_02545 [Polyangiaceae bacterium]
MSSTRTKLAILPMFFTFFAIGCTGQTFDVGGFPAGDGGDAGSTTSDDGGTTTTPDGGVTNVIDPIALNNSWTYDIVVAGTYPTCSTGSGSATVTKHETIAGKDAFFVTSFCSGIKGFDYSAEGDRVYEYDGTNWITALDTPVAADHTWTSATETFVWKKAPDFANAGLNFSDCWEVDDQAYPDYYAVTFCRGVGPVQWHVRDASSNGYDAKLTHKSF